MEQIKPREARLRALAKLNLDLRVLYKRPDGFHEIRTIFQTISLADFIRVRYRPADELHIAIRGSVEIADNLIERAARRVAEELQTGGEFEFTLDKRIPMGAGLGGGSSDAAAVLMALPALVGRSLAHERLARIAYELGSDVAFFLHGGTAVGLGRGEELYPLPDRPLRAGLVIAPALHVSTADAYRALTTRLEAANVDQKHAEFTQVARTGELRNARNDFEEVVFAEHPRLGEIRQALEHAGAAVARMSGSGSAIWGLFDNPGDLEQARAEFAFHGETAYPFTFVSRRQYGAMWTRVARTLQPFSTGSPDSS